MVDASEILTTKAKAQPDNDSERVSINDILNTQIFIYNIDFWHSDMYGGGDRATVYAYLDNPEDENAKKIHFITGSSVLIDQLRQLESVIRQGTIIKATITLQKGKKWRYYTIK